MDRIAGFYRFLWPFLAADEAQVAWVDENMGGRPNRLFSPRWQAGATAVKLPGPK
jgi:hypothetical protein